jgi:tripartite-type tricarboxylate transporter receptor subunit TctC
MARLQPRRIPVNALLRVLCTCLGLVIAANAHAQDTFPDKPIRFLTGFAAGGPTDLSVRALAAASARILGQPVVVQNMPGAGGTLAMADVARQAPDGYTISLITSSYKALTVHQSKPSFDVNELQTLLGYGEFRHILFVREDSPYKTIDDLIRHAKANPGTLKFGHVGPGTSLHVQGLIFFRALGVQVIDVPYKGSSEFTNAVLGGHIDTAFIDIAGIRSLAQAGTVRLLIAITPQRVPEFPDVPTALEKGVEGPELFNPELGVVIRRGTPPDRVKRMHDALRKAIDEPDFVKAMSDMWLKRGYMPPEKFDAIVSKAEARAVPLMREVGLSK